MTREVRLENLDFSGLIRPNDRVVWGQAGAEPLALTSRLLQQSAQMDGFRAFVGMSLSPGAVLEQADRVAFQSYCAAGSNRLLAKAGRLDILPCHYTQLETALAPVDVLLLQVAEGPGGFSFSIAAEYLVPLVKSARLVIAEVNDQAPWTYGETLAEEDINLLVRTSRPPLAMPGVAGSEIEQAIAQHVGGLIEDGSTLQLGLGSLPEAVLSALRSHRDLGIHSGAIGDKVAELTELGVINNSRKRIDTGITVAGVLMGGEQTYRFAHDNKALHLRPTAYTHALDVLAQIDRLITLNSAIEVDLTGQINAEVAAGRYVGAVGGAMDFMRGAHASKGGLPIIALPATAAGGKVSRIVAELSGPVSTPRADAGIIVTEYGVADLRGRTLRERARLMVAIAHPDFRDALARAWGL